MDGDKAIQVLLISEANDKQIKQWSTQLTTESTHPLHIQNADSIDEALRHINKKTPHLIAIEINKADKTLLAKLHNTLNTVPFVIFIAPPPTGAEKIIELDSNYFLLRGLPSSKDLVEIINDFSFKNRLATPAKKDKPADTPNDVVREKTMASNTATKSLSTQKQSQAEALLSDLERRYALILQSAGEGIYGLDAEGRVTFINPAAETLLGFEAGELIGKVQHNVIHHTDENGNAYAIEQCPIHSHLHNHKVRHGEDVFLRKDGGCFPIEYTSTPIIENSHLVGTVVNFRDITERKQSEKRMVTLAHHDSLTNLANRLQFEKTLKKTIGTAALNNSIVALLFIDLDNFKRVNDNLGHHLGDKLLQEVARRLFVCVRHSDFIARLGGDEFAIILPETNGSKDAGKVAQKIISKLAEPFHLDQFRVGVSASVGIACYPDAADSPTELLKSADIAMYRAKELGRNNYQFFSKSIKQKNLQRLKIESSLREALDRNEFFLLFQPKFDLKTRRITGVETLLRWKSPTLGLVLPDKFVPVAEETGLLLSIGSWVIENACQCFSKWHHRFKNNIRLSVNLSPRQLIKHDLTQFLTEVLSKFNIPTSVLELELTETAVMSESEVEHNLKKLSSMGINISIDDFGTGYSSLSRLRYLPINSLKIDKTFISDITTNSNDAIIVESIIALAKSLKLSVVAEGVETAEQLEFLISHGCDQGQGYYFCMPLTMEEMEQMLEKMV